MSQTCICRMFRSPAASYCTLNYKLVEIIKENYPAEYEVLMSLPGQRWVIAGNFICLLLKLTNTAKDMDIFYFNKEFSEKCDKTDWYLSSSSPGVYNVFKHRIYNMRVAEFTDLSPEVSLSDEIFEMLCCFDCVLVRKALHLKSALFVDCNFGPVKFGTTSRQEKFNQRLQQPIVTQPKTLFLIAYECKHKIQ